MLSERQRLILCTIVDDYIRSAEPVGSRSISKRAEVAFSPATIRNEMADLEELGFLEQPHTSAGRIPSIKGYRYYVDHLVRFGHASEEDFLKIRGLFNERRMHWEDSLEQAATMLSQLTNYTSIVLGPEVFNATTLKHFQLLPINEHSAVAIIVANTGHVEHRTINIPEGISMDDMTHIVGILNERLVGVPFSRLKATLYSEIGRELSRYADRCDEILALLNQTIATESEPRVYLSGAANMLNQPEFKDVDKAKGILEMFEETQKLMQAFSTSTSGVQVKIGTENAMEAFNHCSLITATYSLNGQSIGTIGIVGPTRMEYGKVISLLDYLSNNMALMLSKWQK